jgi:hypothetical protein
MTIFNDTTVHGLRENKFENPLPWMTHRTVVLEMFMNYSILFMNSS